MALPLCCLAAAASPDAVRLAEDGGVLFLWLADQLVRFGPIILFVICLLETAIFVGLVLPVGALIGFSALLSARGIMDPGVVAIAAMSGALVGDQLGYTAGRLFGFPSATPRGTVARLWQGGLQRASSLLHRQGLIGVSAARAIPFVRTIMPWFAGRSGMPWPRFFLFDLLGVTAWAAVYLGGGFLAGYGWQAVAARFGEWTGAAIVITGITALAIVFRHWARRFMRRRRSARDAGPPDAPIGPRDS